MFDIVSSLSLYFRISSRFAANDILTNCFATLEKGEKESMCNGLLTNHRIIRSASPRVIKSTANENKIKITVLLAFRLMYHCIRDNLSSYFSSFAKKFLATDRAIRFKTRGKNLRNLLATKIINTFVRWLGCDSARKISGKLNQKFCSIRQKSDKFSGWRYIMF